MNNDKDIWRKRVIASIFGFMNKMGKPTDIDKVKGIATRAAGKEYDTFNKISRGKLQALYNYFLEAQRQAERLKREEAITEMDARLLAISGIRYQLKSKGEC